MMKIFALAVLLYVGGCDAQGIPIEAQKCKPVQAEDTDLIGVILFEVGDSKLTPVSRRIVGRLLAEVVRRDPDGKRVLYLVGHADQLGGDDINVRLSLSRAKSVAQITGELNAARTGAELVACGQDFPLVRQKSEVEHPHNRRVEFRLGLLHNP